jgi:hypothetical protein
MAQLLGVANVVTHAIHRSVSLLPNVRFFRPSLPFMGFNVREATCQNRKPLESPRARMLMGSIGLPRSGKSSIQAKVHIQISLNCWYSAWPNDRTALISWLLSR